MRIAQLIGYDLAASPWSTRPLAFARGLVERGHEVRLCHYPLPDEHTPTMHAPAEWGLAPLGLRKNNLLQLLARVRELVQWCDVFHVQKPVLANGLVLRLAWSRHTPLVYDWDDWEGQGGISDVFYSKRRYWRASLIERHIARRAHRIVYSNDTIAREIARAHQRTEHMSFVPCGAETDHFDPDRYTEAFRRERKAELGFGDGPVIVYHGQLDVDLAQETFLDTVLRLRRDWPVSFLVVGGGRLQQQLMERADALGLGTAVRFTGYIGYREVPDYLCIADLAVILFPDLLYAHCKSPLKLYESMSMALPIVASRIGQVETMLEPDCGVLTAPGHPDQVEAALCRLLQQPRQARDMGRRAREKILQNYTWDHAVDRLEAAYQQTLEQHRAD